jgi:hypothetical protein
MNLLRMFFVFLLSVAVGSTLAFAQGKCLNSDASLYATCINDIEVTYPSVPAGQAPAITLNVHFFAIAQGQSAPDFFQVRFSHTIAQGMAFVRQDNVTGKAWNHGWLTTEPLIPGNVGPPYFFQVQPCYNKLGTNAYCSGFASLTWSPPGQSATPTQQTPATLPKPGTCKQGFVWRQVNPQDHVCVTAQERQQVANDTAAAAAHTVPRGAVRLTTPQPCLKGYVWRQAASSDYVCVTPQSRAAAQADNAAAAARTN